MKDKNKHQEMEGEKCNYCGKQEVFMVTIGSDGIPTGEMGKCQSCGEWKYLKNRISINYDGDIFEEMKRVRKSRDEINLDYGDI